MSFIHQSLVGRRWRMTTTTFFTLLILIIGISFKRNLNTHHQPTWKNQSDCKILNYSSNQDHHESNLNELKFCEDLIHWDLAQLLIISCDGGRKDWNTVMGPLRDSSPRGQLYIYHLDRPLSDTLNNQIKENLYSLDLERFPIESDFHPLGIELHSIDRFTARLFVVNHRGDRSVIEVFEVRLPKEDQIQVKIEWVLTLSDRLLKTPNSIIALSSNSLLISNDHFIDRRQYGLFGSLLHTIETLFRLPGGNLILFEFEDHGFQSTQILIKNLTFPNGIILNQDRSILIISTSTPKKLLFYQLQTHLSHSNLSIQFDYLTSRQLSFGPDNLSIDEEDRLIISGHPSAPKIFLYVFNPHRFSNPPSSIAYLNLRIGLESEVKSLFEDDGEFFMSSSTGLIIRDPNRVDQFKLIATGLYQIGLLECLIFKP
ncbi:hypothetical protein DFH28DRAFT_1177728 [Melampsora americana]|nr:hypothetical protein DFH28DRAFT_1177728 [Melampsora americana]